MPTDREPQFCEDERVSTPEGGGIVVEYDPGDIRTIPGVRVKMDEDESLRWFPAYEVERG
jgi:hypothetical protein